MMFEDMGPMVDDSSSRCSLPGVRAISSNAAKAGDLGDDRRLPPLPRVDPLPRGPFNPFTSHPMVPSPPSSQESFPIKSPWPAGERIVTPPSPANSADSSWAESMPSQKMLDGPQAYEMSRTDLLNLIAPAHLNRKPPLQQLCGRKRKGSLISGESDDQREKHRIAEGNRRKNLSSLHRELDGRLHDYFLECAGWNPSKSLPESKEHIVQGAIHLIDFMIGIIVSLIRYENELPRQLSEKLQPQIRCMQFQQVIANLQQQNISTQQQLKAARQENQILEERNRALELQLKSYEQMFRSPKSEHPTPQQQPQPLVPHHLESKPRHMLPGLRVFCDGIPEPPHSATSQSFPQHGSSSFLSHSPPLTGPSSPVFSYSVPTSRRPSLGPSP